MTMFLKAPALYLPYNVYNLTSLKFQSFFLDTVILTICFGDWQSLPNLQQNVLCSLLEVRSNKGKPQAYATGEGLAAKNVLPFYPLQ